MLFLLLCNKNDINMHCWAIHIVVATLCGKEGLKPWECSLVPRPHPDFSPRLRDKIWVGPGDEATGNEIQ